PYRVGIDRIDGDPGHARYTDRRARVGHLDWPLLPTEATILRAKNPSRIRRPRAGEHDLRIGRVDGNPPHGFAAMVESPGSPHTNCAAIDFQPSPNWLASPSPSCSDAIYPLDKRWCTTCTLSSLRP